MQFTVEKLIKNKSYLSDEVKFYSLCSLCSNVKLILVKAVDEKSVTPIAQSKIQEQKRCLENKTDNPKQKLRSDRKSLAK